MDKFGFVAVASRYNLACAAAMRGDRERALRLLGEALAGGFVYARRVSGRLVLGSRGVRTDPHLASLLGDPRFEVLVSDGSASEMLLAIAQLAASGDREAAKRLLGRLPCPGTLYPALLRRLADSFGNDPEIQAILDRWANTPVVELEEPWVGETLELELEHRAKLRD